MYLTYQVALTSESVDELLARVDAARLSGALRGVLEAMLDTRRRKQTDLRVEPVLQVLTAIFCPTSGDGL